MELAKIENQAVNIWHDSNKIKTLFAPKLTQDEFSFFVSLGSALGANPFTREIWAVKYDEKQPASIFCGRDFYRRKAQELQEYDGHTVDAVYENDSFLVKNGIPEHNYQLKNRGSLIGAYCIVYKKHSRPFYCFVELKEYAKGFGVWKTSPATMIKKVAEAQALRASFQSTFQGTYDESEQWISSEVIEIKEEPNQSGKKQPLSADRFQKAISKLKALEIDVLKSLSKFELTPEQLSEVQSECYLIKQEHENSLNSEQIELLKIYIVI